MARSYCTAEEVKRVLRVAAQKVRTSEAYRDLGHDLGNIGLARLTGVVFQNSYVGNERFEVTFSDSTNFEAVGEDSGFLGFGKNDEDFLCAYFEILSSLWLGIPETNDKFHFISCSNVSNDDLDSFIDGVSKWINNRLGSHYGDTSNIPWEIDISLPIPEALNYAAIYRTASEIFSTALAGVDLSTSPVSGWNNLAQNTIRDFITWKEEEGVLSTPRWISRETEDDDTFDMEEDKVYRR